MLASESLLARASTQRREFVVGSIATILILVAIAVTRLIEPDGLGAPAAPTVARSLVVLPFQSANEKRFEWISYGVAHEISITLAKVPGLRVAPTSSALAADRSDSAVRELATLLNVGAVLRGAARLDGSTLRLTVQLISLDDDTALWAAELARDTQDLRDLGDEIAEPVAAALRAQLGLPKTPLASTPTRDPRVQRLLLRTAHLRERGSSSALDSARLLLDEAVRRDSTHARAWSDLATLLATLSDSGTGDATRSRSIDAALRAIALDGTLAEPHVALAHVHAARSDVQPAMREYVAAIRLDPRLASARYGHSRLLSREGRVDEALREARRAHELDPLAATVHLNYAQMLARAGHNSDAKREMAELSRITDYLRAHE